MKWRSVRSKLILSYLLVGTVLLLLFSAIVVNSIYRTSREDAFRDVEALLEQNFRTVEALIEDVVANMNERFINDESVIMGLFAEDLDRALMYDIHAALREMARESRIVDSIYLHNGYLDLTFSSLSAVRPPEEFYEESLSALIERARGARGPRLIPRHVDLRYVTIYPKKNRWISLLMAPKVETTESVAVVNISQEALQSFIYRESTGLPESIEPWIIGNDGVVISHEEPELFAADVADSPHIRRILETPDRRGGFETRLDGHRVAVGFIKSASLDCFFMTVVAYDELLRSARNYRNLFIGITIALLVAGLIETLFFTRIIYSPLENLVHQAEVLLPGETGGKERSEYEIVSSLINYAGLRLSEAQRRINEYIPEKKRGALINLLQDTLTVETPPEYWQHEYDIDLSGPFYIVGVVVLYLPMHAYTGYDRYRLFHHRRSTIIEFIYRELSKLFPIQIVDVSLRQIAWIANIPTERTAPHRDGLAEAAERIVRRIDEVFGEAGMVSTGPVVGSIDDIPSSYDRCAETAKYRFVFSGRALLEHSESILESRIEYEYPIWLERRILDELSLGHERELEHGLHEFAEAVRHFRYNEILLSCTQLVLMISRGAPPSIEMSIQERWAQLTAEQRLTDSRTLEDVVGWMLKAASEIVADAKRREGTEHAVIAQHVQSMVAKRYSDSSLCAAALADEVGFSTNHLRRIFKDVTGVSLSEHIAQIRFDCAARLLTTTTLPAKEIARRCGFFNPDYFYYAFRKRTGETPGNYRKFRKSWAFVKDLRRSG